MLTTKQVRAIMQKHNVSTYGLWTNKTAGDTSNIRRVKCYAPSYAQELVVLVKELQKVAGVENVRLTQGDQCGYGYGRPGITVRCVLA